MIHVAPQLRPLTQRREDIPRSRAFIAEAEPTSTSATTSPGNGSRPRSPRPTDKPLLERRLKAGPQHEKEWSQKIIVSLVFVGFFALIVLPALDHRFGWSPVASWVTILADILIVLSFLFMFWVLKVNSFAASNVRVEQGQQVIDTGPYAYVRHPMYAGAFWLLVGIPLALGSWWSLGLIVLCLPVLLWRLLDEEKILRKDLPGYTAYTHKVPYRLIPHVW
jgi:protein-S-isoprenylcysteine O-methyltransferase Ste14